MMREHESLGMLNRRSFVAAGASVLAALGVSGCSSNTVMSVTGDEAASDDPGEWKPVACWHNCAGICPNYALIKDGVAVHQKSDFDSKDDGYNLANLACQRGRSERYQIYGIDRIKYPMKRKHWEPGGTGDNSLRGKDEWERLSWDEALDLVAGEIARCREQYGMNSVYVSGGDDLMNGMAFTGGYTSAWTTSSGGNTVNNLKVGFGSSSNDRFDLVENADYVIMLGNGGAWNGGGNTMLVWQQARDAGVQFIGIDPFFHDTYVSLKADWIPVRPGTDTALLAAVAYTMLEEDDPETDSLIDWDHLQTFCVGFDESTMPEGAEKEESFKDYLLGVRDGVAKTPEWASEICGAEPEKIRELARINGRQNNVCWAGGMAPFRATGSESLPQMLMTVAAMGGHQGKPGNYVCTGNVGVDGSDGSTSPFIAGDKGLTAAVNPVEDRINDVALWQSIDNGEYLFSDYYFPHHLVAPTYPEEKKDSYHEMRPIDIKVVYFGGLNGWGHGMEMGSFTQKPHIAKGIEVLRKQGKVDAVFSNSYIFDLSAQYADVVLPACTPWEKPGYLWSLGHANDTVVIFDQAIEPLYESRSDQDITRELVNRLGFNADELYPFSERQQFFNQLATSQVLLPSGETSNLVSITEEEISAWGVEGSPQEGAITLTDAVKQGRFRVERQPGDALCSIGDAAYFADPVAAPRLTTTGKQEIYCPEFKSGTIADTGWGTFTPIPKFTPGQHGYTDTFEDWEARKKGDYPFQLMNVHYGRRSHSTSDSVAVLRETWPNTVFINKADAEELGIRTGDTVLITSPWGKALRIASATARMMPGVVSIPQGAWPDFDEETGIDHGGCANTLCGPVSSGFGIFAPNTEICRIERYDDVQLQPDALRPTKTPNL